MLLKASLRATVNRFARPFAVPLTGVWMMLDEASATWQNFLSHFFSLFRQVALFL